MKVKLAAALVVIVIVVVLVGIFVYLCTIGFSIQTPRPPSASFSSAEQDSATTMRLTFGEVDPSIQYMRLKIILHYNDTVRDVYLGTYPFDPGGTGYINTIAGGQNYSIFYDDVDSDGLVDTGEYSDVMYSGASLPAGSYTVSLIWMGSGSAIAVAHILV
ncbi:MAG: hypothetical protein LUQ55_00140 [Methanomassiliicoccales archaeon]|nr:hypothetical protein [Methanomassiliicoccales archaeon]